MCSKQFTRQLKVHERMHTGEKCGEMFMKSVHLKAHLEDIHFPKPSTENDIKIDLEQEDIKEENTAHNPCH